MTAELIADELRRRARTYRADATTLYHLVEPVSDAMTNDQWALIYKTVADELCKVAQQLDGRDP